MISVMEADRLLEQHMPRLPLRTVALAEATGAVLAGTCAPTGRCRFRGGRLRHPVLRLAHLSGAAAARA